MFIGQQVSFIDDTTESPGHFNAINAGDKVKLVSMFLEAVTVNKESVNVDERVACFLQVDQIALGVQSMELLDCELAGLVN